MTKAAASAQPAPVATALVISDDEATVRQLTESMQQFAISAEVCQDAGFALQSLNRRHFEAVVVDLKMYQSKEIMERVRLSPSNQTATTFAITDGSASGFSTGANFVLERPLSDESLSRSLRAAYGIIMRERRRYFRCPVTIPVAVRNQEGQETQCETINISESGIAVRIPNPVKAGTEVAVQFKLPENQTRFVIQSKICWSDPTGRTGLQFLNLPLAQKTELQGWLSHRLEEVLPEAVASKFQKPAQS
ncbi:MAG: PilZ domain-containing protein [Terriglobales bacterium]|jgi:DNA-binding response OmpR family regulator